MPENLNLSDFSAGWTPSDDPINGRPNGLLKMDSLELDQNGAIKLSGGSALLYTYSVDAHTIYARFLKDAQYRYITDTAGATFRNTTSIKTGGSTVRSGFGSAFDFVICFSGAKRFRDDGTTVTDLGITKPTVPVTSLNGAGVLTGTYTYAQVNVIVSGNGYIARSPVSVEAAAVTAAANKINIDPSNPAGSETEVWIFRRGGSLDQYYRVYRQTASLGTAFDDNLSDIDALQDGIILDLNALSVTSTDLPDDILEVVGPVNRRMIYFSKNAIHFSEINSPDSYHAGQSLYYAGGLTGTEIFLFARKINENIILVGTTHDFYILTGTFITQPNGTLDVYLRGLTVENPPISIDADTYNGSIICMTAAGWKITDYSGNQTNLIDERVDRIYRGETLQGYGGVPIYIIPQYRYSCAAVRDKLFVRVPQIVGNNPATTFTYRMEVYDFKRKYWRPLPEYNPLMLFGQQDDAVMGFFGTSHTLRSIDDQFTKLNNGSNQTINLKTLIQTFSKPQTRKKVYNISFKVNTGGSTITLNIYTLAGTLLSYTTAINSSQLTNFFLELNTSVVDPNDVQIEFTGACADFLLTNVNISYDFYPDALTSVHLILNTDSHKKRVRGFRIKLDNRGTTMDCIPYIDGVLGTQSNFNGDATTAYPKTHAHYFSTDIFATDLKIKLLSQGGTFELYNQGEIDVVQVLPLAKRFDQLGPIELFRYGKLKRFEIRLIPFGGTTIPYTIYFEDVSSTTGNITCVDGKEGVFSLNLPKDVEGSILRVELGPTAFDFHRIYGRMQVQKSGKNTEIEWVTIDDTQLN